MSSKENHKTTIVEENSIKTDKSVRKKTSDRSSKTTGMKNSRNVNEQKTMAYSPARIKSASWVPFGPTASTTVRFFVRTLASESSLYASGA